MFISSPSDEAPTIRRMLISWEKGSEFSKVFAYVVRDAWPKMLAGNDYRYDTDATGMQAEGFRRASWSSSKKNAVYVNDLQIRAQITMKDADPKPYSTGMVFYDAMFIERKDAEAMANTFKKIDAKLDSLDKQFGYVNNYDFAGYLLRVAQTMGIDEFVCLKRDYRGNNGNNGSVDLTQTKCYMRFSATSVKSIVEEIVEMLVK